ASDPNYTITYVAGTLRIIRPVAGDYTGAGLTNLAVYNPTTGVWKVNVSPSPAAVKAIADADPVAGNYSGAAKAAEAVFVPSTATWTIAGEGSNVFGPRNSVPVPGNYSGTSQTFEAVYVPVTATSGANGGKWIIWGQPTVVVTTAKSGDIPVPGNYA